MQGSMAERKDSSFCFPQLNDSNFSIWCYRMEAYLVKERVWRVIAEDPPTPVTEAWNNDDAKAKALITLAVSDQQLVNIRGKQTAKLMWTALETIHLRRGTGSTIVYFKQMYRAELAPDGDLAEHLRNLRSLRDELLRREVEIPDLQFCYVVLSSLNESYESIAAQLAALPTAELTLELIQAKLMAEVDRRVASRCNDAAANSQKHISNSRGNLTAESEKIAALKVRRCFSCGEIGHLRRDCKKRNKQGQGQQKGVFKRQVKALVAVSMSKKRWDHFVIDSGATRNMCKDKSLFVSLTKQKGNIHLANGEVIKSEGLGTVFLKSLNTSIKNVIYAPELTENLLSVSQLTEQNFVVKFSKFKCELIKNNKVILYAKQRNGLFLLSYWNEKEEDDSQCCEVKTLKSKSNAQLHDNCIHSYHRLFGHLNFKAISKMQPVVEGMKLKSCKYHMKCVSCAKHKVKQVPKGKITGRKAEKPFQFVHGDLVGPLKVSRGGANYFMVLIDQYTRYSFVYMLQKKNEAFEKFKSFCAWVKNKHNTQVTSFFTDRGGEFCSVEFERYLSQQGIEHMIATPRSPWQNGLCERMNQTLLQGIKTLLHDANLGDEFWAEALNCFNYVRNRSISSAIECTPYQKLYNKKPSVNHFKIFGSDMWVHTPQNQKLQEKGQHGIFLGYDKGSYRVLMTNTQNIRLTRSVEYNVNWERVGIFQSTHVDESETESNDSDNDESEDSSNKRDSLKQSEESGSDVEDKKPLHTIDTEEEDSDADSSEDEHVGVRKSERSTKGIPPVRYSDEFAGKTIYEPQSFKGVKKSFEENAKPWFTKECTGG